MAGPLSDVDSTTSHDATGPGTALGATQVGVRGRYPDMKWERTDGLRVVPIVRDVNVAGLLSQIATDGDYNPFSLRNLGQAEISTVREALSSPSLGEAALAVLATLREPFDVALVPQELPLPL